MPPQVRLGGALGASALPVVAVMIAVLAFLVCWLTNASWGWWCFAWFLAGACLSGKKE